MCCQLLMGAGQRARIVLHGKARMTGALERLHDAPAILPLPRRQTPPRFLQGKVERLGPDAETCLEQRQKRAFPTCQRFTFDHVPTTPFRFVIAARLSYH